jgi:hypothetical protein
MPHQQAQLRNRWSRLAVTAGTGLVFLVIARALKPPAVLSGHAPPGQADRLADLLGRAQRARSGAPALQWPDGVPADLFAPLKQGAVADRADSAGTRPADTAVDADARRLIRVQAVLIGNPRLATLNERVLRPGDVIEGFRLEEVLPGGVLLSRDGATVHLPLDPGR